MDNEKQQRAILGGVCLALVIAIIVALIFLVASIFDAICS